MRDPVRRRPGATVLSGLLAVTVLLRLTACVDAPEPTAPVGPQAGEDADGPTVAAPVSSTASVSESVVLVGAADIAHCGSNQGDEQTASLINNVLAADPTATVFAAGDVVYDHGTAAEFTNCYDPSWGQFKARTRPAIGNHEYEADPTANPYWDYFGEEAAGERGKGYYSYDIGNWHIVVLNSNVNIIGTKAGSPQEIWLQDDLASTSQPCILAYWHTPRFRSSTTAPLPAPKGYVHDFWKDLYAERADILLHGDQHFYERFAPQTPDGVADPVNGIRQFVVGTGGKSVAHPTVLAPNSEFRDGTTFGVLKLTLGDGTYSWQFISVAGGSNTDSGSGTCHPKTPVGALSLNAGDNQSATVGTAVATRPSVKVIDASGNPVEGVAVTFAITSGGGTATAISRTTTTSGIATVGSWTLGTTAGANTMIARASGVDGSPITFTATGAPGSVSAATSTATVPAGAVGSPTNITVQSKDQFGNNVPTGGAAVVVAISGANPGSPAVTDQGDGTYTTAYTPTVAGTDQAAITLGGTAISGSPYSSTVAGGGGGSGNSLAINTGNNQSAVVGTTVAAAPSVKVTNGSGTPVQGVAVTFAVASGGGSVAGPSQTTDASGIATAAGWTLGTTTGTNTLTATSSGLGGSPVTFTATGTPGAAAAAASTATVPNGTVGSPTDVTVQAKDQFGNNLTTGGATVTVAVTGANSASPTVTDEGNGRYTATYTPSATGTDQLAIRLGGAAIEGSPYTSTVSQGAAAQLAIEAGDNQTAPAGSAVPISPSVKVTDAAGNPVPGELVSFDVRAGGGSITGASQTTNASGIATLGSWTLGPVPSADNRVRARLPGSTTVLSVNFLATGTEAAIAGTSTATVPDGTVGSPTTITVQSKDGSGTNFPTGGATVVVTVSGANSATPSVTDNGNGTYTAAYTPTAGGTDQVAITLNGGAISGSPYASAVSGPSVGSPAVMTFNAGNNQSAPAGTPVAIPPSVRVSDATGNPVPGVAITFSIQAGGGSLTGGSQTTNASGTATVGSWTLGPTAGVLNKLKARTRSLPSVVFNATATTGGGGGGGGPGPVSGAQSTATVPNGAVGSPTPIAVQGKDASGTNVTTGGATVLVTVSGTNSASPAVTDNGNGTYAASYTPTTAGSDQVAITLNGTALGGSPYTSTVSGGGGGGGGGNTIAVSAGNNQTAPRGTTVATRPAVKVTDANGDPVAGVVVTFTVSSGGGSVTGFNRTTGSGGIARLGSWTLGPTAGTNTLTATASGPGMAGNPVTFTATGT